MQVLEIEDVRGESPGEFPDSFDRRKVRAVGREEQQFENVGAFVEEGLEELGVVVAGVVQHDDDLASRRAAAEHQAKELLELDRV